MRNVFLYLPVLFPFVLFAQKDTFRSLDADNIQRLEIYIDEVYKISLATSKDDKIVLSTHSEGEYFNDIYLEVEQFENSMVLTSGFRKILQSGYDKLSAHKVFSLEINLTIPEGLQVYIKSNISAVNATGKYKDLQVELESGACRLQRFEGNAIINTYRGKILVETDNAVVKASSGSGVVEVPGEMKGNNRLELRSINGDIKVVKN